MDFKLLADLMAKKGLIFKSVTCIDKKLLGSRKKLDIFLCVDRKSYYHVIFSINQKSRFLLKNANEILYLEAQIQSKRLHANKFKHLFVQENMCSKARYLLEQSGWRVYNDFV